MTGHVGELAHGLVAAGVTHAFGVAGGGRSLDLIAELEGRGVAYVPVGHEAAAVMAAGAACRDGVTRACALGIKGPGVANMVPGVALNRLENRPALTAAEAHGPGPEGGRWHKRLDHVAMLSSLVKAHEFADGTPAQAERLLALARAEVPGPVHVDLADAPEPAVAAATGAGEPADPDALERVLEAVAAARRPALVLGSLAIRVDARWDVARVPVCTTAAAKGAYDERLGLSAGVVTGEVAELSPESNVLAEADLIVGFGLRSTEVVRAAPYGCRLAIVDAAGGGPHDGFEPTLVAGVDDPGAAARKVLAAAQSSPWGEPEVAAWRDALAAELYADAWLPARALRALRDGLSDPILVTDTGLFCTVAETEWPVSAPAGYSGSGIARFMGVAVPTALGVAATAAGRPCVCVMGDGGLRPYIAELRTAVDERLDVLFVLMSDGRYGTFADAAPGRGASARAVEVPDPGWWRVAESLGVPAAVCEDEESLVAALESRDPGPAFLQLPFDPARYATMTRRLR